ncbi:MAG: hypothetical protein ACKVT1_06640 [Dehalococcoidia bacterium]
MEVKKASEWDKAYIRRLGEYEREGRIEWLGYLQSLTIDERLRRSFARTEHGKPYERREPEDLQAFYDRARRLGLHNG